MAWIEWGKFALIVATFVVGTAIPFIIAVVKAIKKRNHAKTDAEKAQADAELMTLAKQLIVNVEHEYKDYNAYLKARGQSAGTVKKNSVLTDLKQYAIEKGYKFIESEWSIAIDKLVDFTRNVNTNK